MPTDAVELLLDAAFGADRHGRTAYRLREGVDAIPTLSWGAVDLGGVLVGSVQCWPVALVGAHGATPLVLVGPVAVAPARQRDSIGRRLTEAALMAADAEGRGACVLIGDPEYYGRFGFDAAHTAGWSVPGPVERRRLLARVAPGIMLPAGGALRPDMVQLDRRIA